MIINVVRDRLGDTLRYIEGVFQGARSGYPGSHIEKM
jgi:hypothetical protein